MNNPKKKRFYEQARDFAVKKAKAATIDKVESSMKDPINASHWSLPIISVIIVLVNLGMSGYKTYLYVVQAWDTFETLIHSSNLVVLMSPIFIGLNSL